MTQVPSYRLFKEKIEEIERLLSLLEPDDYNLTASYSRKNIPPKGDRNYEIVTWYPSKKLGNTAEIDYYYGDQSSNRRVKTATVDIIDGVHEGDAPLSFGTPYKVVFRPEKGHEQTALFKRV